MKRTVLFATVFALTPGYSIYGQQTCFDVARRQDGLEYEHAVATSEGPGSFLTLSLCDSSAWNGPRIRTTLFNEEGSYQEDRMFQFGSGTYQLRVEGCRNMGGEMVAVVGTERMGVAADSIYMLRFDHVGDTTAAHLVQTGTVLYPTGIIEANNGDLIISAYNGQPPSAMFSRVSPNGTLLYSGFALAPSFIPYGLAESPSTDVFLCGFGTSDDPYNINLGVIVKCDLLGNLQWYRTTPWWGIYMAAIATEDGGVIAMGQMSNAAFLQKFDSEGNELWFQLVSTSDEPFNSIGVAILRDGHITENGDLVACGNVLNVNSPHDRGLICRVDQDGNILWIRFRTHYPLGAGYFPQRYFDIEPTQDGGLILCGSTNGLEPDDVSHLWLNKLDIQGNLGPECIFTSTREIDDSENMSLYVFPNPAVDVCYVKTPISMIDLDPYEYVIRDALGRVVRHQKYHGITSTGEIAIWLGGLSPGPFWIELHGNGRGLGIGKVMLVEAH